MRLLRRGYVKLTSRLAIDHTEARFLSAPVLRIVGAEIGRRASTMAEYIAGRQQILEEASNPYRRVAFEAGYNWQDTVNTHSSKT